jgi:osmotically inducible protein OsmC
MIRTAQANWKGTGKDGSGDLGVASGVLSHTPYSYKTRFEDAQGTNPEELLAAAHAGCFTMATAFRLQAAGFTPDSLTTDCAVSIEPDGGGFKITRSALTLKASVPGLDKATFDQLVKEAKETCPVSRLFNTEITLEATLG